MKIIEKINSKIDNGETFYSFEYFPPKTDEGVKNLHQRQIYMKSLDPLFCDITWGAGGSTADLTLTIAEKMQNEVQAETMMHLTCTNMPVEKLEAALQQCKEAGIRNILALRGDPPHGEDKFTQVEGGFACALDLVKYIREKHGDYFGICVSGYPEAHPDQIVDDPEEMKKKYWEDIDYLKKKVEAGADFVITQLFYDVDLFLKFVTDCKSAGINVPILPGIMPIMNYGGFKRMTSFCKTYVPEHITNVLETIKTMMRLSKAFGVSLGTQMCQRLLAAGVPGLHMYTLNLDKSAVGILKNVGLIPADKVKN
eukprot:jgi/Picre1/31320/NNA_006673.t1